MIEPVKRLAEVPLDQKPWPGPGKTPRGGNGAKLNSEGFIEIKFSGRLEVATAEKVLREAEGAMEGMDRGAPIFILLDLTDLEGIHVEARRLGAYWLRQGKFYKIAIFGRRYYIKAFVTFIFIATRQTAHMSFNRTRAEAVEWLKKYRNK